MFIIYVIDLSTKNKVDLLICALTFTISDWSAYVFVKGKSQT